MADAEREGDIYDPRFVKDVFDKCSDTYIFMSYFFSFGFTERWRRQCVAALNPPPSEQPVGYDLMAGTGEVWPHLVKRIPNVGKIVAVDISSGMHMRAMKRLSLLQAHHIGFVEDDVLASNLPAESADFVVSTFGLKTFKPEQHRQLAELTAHLLKPGGVFSFIEASDPDGWALAGLYRFYMRRVLPWVERLLLRGAQDFAMIGTYTARFGDASGFAAALAEAGLEVDYSRYFYGCATGVSGRKRTA